MFPGMEQLHDKIPSGLEEGDTQQTIYKQWVATERSTLETHCAIIDNLLMLFVKNLSC